MFNKSAAVGAKDKERAHRTKQALAMFPKSDRMPAIDLRTVDDVSTAACVELSRSIMLRPEVNTGMFFSAVSASRNEVNKSDAVIVIVSTILDTLGNKRAAEKVLRKSKSVLALYENLNLNREELRNSFVILLFALAPEFVKMIESSLINSIRRAQEMTEAPHASSKLGIATGELLRTNMITEKEFLRMSSEVNRLTIEAGPAQAEEADVVMVEDSASNTGRRHCADVRLNERSLMDYIKRTPAHKRNSFSSEFPSVRQPVKTTARKGTSGLGFWNESRIGEETASVGGITAAINDLMPPFPSPVRVRTNSLDLKSAGFGTNPLSVRRDSAVAVKPDVSHWSEAVVDKKDIEEKTDILVQEAQAASKLDSVVPASAMTEEEARAYLNDLL